MKNLFKRTMLIGLMGLTSMVANADVSTVSKNLKIKFPATEISNIEESPIKGVYEVTLGKSIAYTDVSGDYFLFGDVIRMKDQQNMTSPKRDELKKIDFSVLPLGDAITYKKGKGERKLAVFSDPQCPYCKRLEVELMKLDNVTIYVFTNPLATLHPEARNLSKKIWCSKDKAKAWRDYLISGIEPTSDGLCTNPVDANVKLSRDLGFQGTPMTLLTNGEVVAGAVSAGELDYKLDKAQLAKKK